MDANKDAPRVTRDMQLVRLREPVTREARIANMVEHMLAEKDNDLERLMATVGPNPQWDLHPIGYWKGWDTVREMYWRNFPFEPEGPEEMIKGVTDPRVAMWGEDHVIFHMALFADDYPRHRNLTILMKFEGNLVKGETVFLTDEKLIDAMIKVVNKAGTDKLPGFHALPR